MIFAIIFVTIFFDLDPAKSFPLRHATRAVSKQLGALVEASVKTISMTKWVSGLVDGMFENDNPLKDYGVHMIRSLLASGLGPSEVTWSHIMPTAGAMIANQAEVVGGSSIPHRYGRVSPY